MKVLLISEHYDSFIGGTTTYVNSVSDALAARKVEVELIVPNTHTNIPLEIVTKTDYLRIHYIGSPQILASNYRKSRADFVNRVNSYLSQVINQISPDVLHVLVGMYLIAGLEIEKLRIPCCVTLHNVPPRECSLTWEADSPFAYFKEKIKLNLIKAINYRRLLRHKYDAYISGSFRFGQILSTIIPDRKIISIEDGFCANIEAEASKHVSNSVYRLLTIGAYIPHKGQHLILEAAAILRDRGFNFTWTTIGPIRAPRYYQYLQKQVSQLGLSQQVDIRVDVSRQELEAAYAHSNIYIQPSLEEGFCFTALEAALYKLPIIGTNEGAIPEIIRRGQGILCAPSTASLVEAILQVASSLPNYTYTDEQFDALVEHYSWQRMTDELLNLYQDLIVAG